MLIPASLWTAEVRATRRAFNHLTVEVPTGLTGAAGLTGIEELPMIETTLPDRQDETRSVTLSLPARVSVIRLN
jgi:hypothetical protein